MDSSAQSTNNNPLIGRMHRYLRMSTIFRTPQWQDTSSQPAADSVAKASILPAEPIDVAHSGLNSHVDEGVQEPAITPSPLMQRSADPTGDRLSSNIPDSQPTKQSIPRSHQPPTQRPQEGIQLSGQEPITQESTTQALPVQDTPTSVQKPVTQESTAHTLPVQDSPTSGQKPVTQESTVQNLPVQDTPTLVQKPVTQESTARTLPVQDTTTSGQKPVIQKSTAQTLPVQESPSSGQKLETQKSTAQTLPVQESPSSDDSENRNWSRLETIMRLHNEKTEADEVSSPPTEDAAPAPDPASNVFKPGPDIEKVPAVDSTSSPPTIQQSPSLAEDRIESAKGPVENFGKWPKQKESPSPADSQTLLDQDTLSSPESTPGPPSTPDSTTGIFEPTASTHQFTADAPETETTPGMRSTPESNAGTLEPKAGVPDHVSSPPESATVPSKPAKPVYSIQRQDTESSAGKGETGPTTQHNQPRNPVLPPLVETQREVDRPGSAIAAPAGTEIVPPEAPNSVEIETVQTEAPKSVEIETVQTEALKSAETETVQTEAPSSVEKEDSTEIYDTSHLQDIQTAKETPEMHRPQTSELPIQREPTGYKPETQNVSGIDSSETVSSPPNRLEAPPTSAEANLEPQPLESTVAGSDQSLVAPSSEQSMPLNLAWPVDRVEPSSKQAEKLPQTVHPKTTVMRQPLPEDDQVREKLAKISPGKPTSSSVQLTKPRGNRPKLAASTSANVPQESVQTKRDQKSDPSRTDIGESTSSPHRTDEPSQGTVATEVGDLPADLWQLIGQDPPAPPAPTQPGAQIRQHGNLQSKETTADGQVDQTQFIQLQEDDSAAGDELTPPSDSGSTEDEDEDKPEDKVDIDALAHEVYNEIKNRLAVDSERMRRHY